MSDRDLLDCIDEQIARNSEALDRNSEAFERHARQMARLDDLHDESRAQRQALLALTDEIRSGGLGRGRA